MLLEADKLVVDRWAYVSYRVPEMIELIQAGKLSEADVHAEWPDIIGRRAIGRETEDEIILYIALGIWGEYAAILPEVYRRAVRQYRQSLRPDQSCRPTGRAGGPARRNDFTRCPHRRTPRSA